MEGVLLFLFYLLLLLPVFSIIYLAINVLSFRYYQNFDTEHPSKGEKVKYSLQISNESFLPAVNVRIKFKAIQPGSGEEIEELNLSLDPFSAGNYNFIIRCPYRGTYTVGLEFLELSDLLHWVTFRIPVWYRTFYVYPGIVNIRNLFTDGQSRVTSGSFKGSTMDTTQLQSLTEYRNGQSIKHIAWKKFLSTGQVFVRTYERSSRPGIDIYLDLRRRESPNPEILRREDCSIEIMVALVKYFLDNNTPVSIHAVGKSRFDFSGSDRSSFHSFYQATINLIFQGVLSPGFIFDNDFNENKIKTSSVLFISHLLDPEIFDLATESRRHELSISAVLNRSGMSIKEQNKATSYINSIREAGGEIMSVRSPGTIKEDLEL